MPEHTLIRFTCLACGTGIIPREQVAPAKKSVWRTCPVCNKRREMKVTLKKAVSLEAVA